MKQWSLEVGLSGEMIEANKCVTSERTYSINTFMGRIGRGDLFMTGGRPFICIANARMLNGEETEWFTIKAVGLLTGDIIEFKDWNVPVIRLRLTKEI